MIFQQFRHEQGGCLSYLIGCAQKEVCAVIDPQYDTDQYLAYAEAHELRITHIFETHAQADHLSGAKKLSGATEAPVHFHESTQAKFPIVRLKDGQETVVVADVDQLALASTVTGHGHRGLLAQNVEGRAAHGRRR